LKTVKGRVQLFMGNLLQSCGASPASHSVTCHQTQANVPYFHPSSIGWYLIYLIQRDGRLSWPCVGYIPARWFTRLQTVTHPSS